MQEFWKKEKIVIGLIPKLANLGFFKQRYLPIFEFFIAGNVIDLDKTTLEPDLDSKFGEKILTIFV